jgi:hypothetical protein
MASAQWKSAINYTAYPIYLSRVIRSPPFYFWLLFIALYSICSRCAPIPFVAEPSLLLLASLSAMKLAFTWFGVLIEKGFTTGSPIIFCWLKKDWYDIWGYPALDEV